MNRLGESVLRRGYKEDPERFLHAWGVQGESNHCRKIGSQCRSLFTKPWCGFSLSGVPAAKAKAKDPSSALQRCLPPSRYLCEAGEQKMCLCVVCSLFSERLSLRSVISANNIMIKGVCLAQETHTHTHRRRSGNGQRQQPDLWSHDAWISIR